MDRLRRDKSDSLNGINLVLDSHHRFADHHLRRFACLNNPQVPVNYSLGPRRQEVGKGEKKEKELIVGKDDARSGFRSADFARPTAEILSGIDVIFRYRTVNQSHEEYVDSKINSLGTLLLLIVCCQRQRFLGSSSGDVRGLLGWACGEQRHSGRWPFFLIPVLDTASVRCLVRLETPRRRRPRFTRTCPRLARILYVPHGGVGGIVLGRYGLGTYCMGRARRWSIFTPDPLIDWHWFGR